MEWSGEDAHLSQARSDHTAVGVNNTKPGK